MARTVKADKRRFFRMDAHYRLLISIAGGGHSLFKLLEAPVSA